MPIVASNFNGNVFVKGSHVETILPGLMRKLTIPWVRKRVQLIDGDFIDIDWLKNNNRKLLFLLHGLEGSSQSQYIKGFAKYFSEKGFDICAMNFRSCSGELNKLLRSYHSGATEDLNEVLSHVLQTNAYSDVYLTGFSLGGNLLLRYLGENKYLIPPEVKRACAFSVPVDLKAGSKKMESTANSMYMLMFLKSLNQKLRMKAAMFPGQIDLSGLTLIRTFHEWDDRFTAPLHGFKGCDDYYQSCSSLFVLNQIKVPTLLVNARNDPFLAESCFPAPNILGEHLLLETPSNGGHCGFSYRFPNGNYYSEDRAFHFFSNKEPFLYV
jgi:predicted alpha/beta-fold hydrolase